MKQHEYVTVYMASGTGKMPRIDDDDEQPADEMPKTGVYGLEIRYYHDAPTVPFIRVEAMSEEEAVSAYEAVRATLAGMELFPGPVAQGEEAKP